MTTQDLAQLKFIKEWMTGHNPLDKDEEEYFAQKENDGLLVYTEG